MKKTPPHTQLSETLVTIVGTDPDSGRILVRDSMGVEFEIDGSVRRKGTGVPMPEETWIIERRGNVWVPDVMVGAPGVPTITGSREGLHPIVSQMLNMLAEHSLVIDSTVSVAAPVIPDVPAPLPDPTEDYPADHDPATDPSPTEVPPSDNGPAPEPDPTPVTVTDPNPDPTTGPTAPEPDPVPVPVATTPAPPPVATTPSPVVTGWSPLYLGSYNTLKDVGPAGAYADLLRLASTRLQVIGLQEAHNEDRNGIFDRMRAQGWGVYRPKTGTFSDENTILWRSKDFSLLDKGVQSIGHYSVPPFHAMPTRYLNWVKLLHYRSGRVFFFMDTHLDPHLESGGAPRYDWKYAEGRLAANFAMISTIAAQMQEFGKTAPVFTAGDWNIDFTGDARVRDSRFPYARFGAISTRSNWGIIQHRPAYGTAGSRLIDQVWGTRLIDWHVRAVDQWILTGYRSDHRPVMVKYSIRSKT